MSRVAVAGHVCVDLTPRAARLSIAPGELSEVGPLAVSLGGSVANTGRALAALGHAVTVSTRVGDDDLGAIATDHFARTPGVAGHPTVTAGHATSYSIVLEPDGADRSFWHHVGANARFDGTETEVDGADVVHLGYPSLLPLLIEDTGAGLRGLLARAKAAGATTSVDLAVVDADSPVEWTSLLTSVMPLIDVISPSADDLRSALHAPGATAGEFVDLLLSWGAGVAAVSDGGLGLVVGAADAARLGDGGRALAPLAAEWSDAHVHEPAARVRRHVTTNGAGDAATAGLLSGILHAQSPASAARYATTAAAAVIQGDPPSTTPAAVAADEHEGVL